MKSLLFILGVCVASATVQQSKFDDIDQRKKIVVVDTPISDFQLDKPYMCKNGSVASSIGFKSHFSDMEYMMYGQHFRHGQNIVGIIGSKIDWSRYCIYHIAWFQPGREEGDHQEGKRFYIEALKRIKGLKNVVAVNMSLSGPNNKDSYFEEEFKILEDLTSNGIKVIVAEGNDHQVLTENNCYVFPACLQKEVSHPENFYVVEGLRPNKLNHSDYLKVQYEQWSNQGFPEMNGTSQAAANFTGKLFSGRYHE